MKAHVTDPFVVNNSRTLLERTLDHYCLVLFPTTRMRRLIKGKCRLLSGQGPAYDIAVSLGPNDGVLSLKGWILPTFIVRGAKCRDLMVGRFWKEMNQTPPA